VGIIQEFVSLFLFFFFLIMQNNSISREHEVVGIKLKVVGNVINT